MIALMGSSGLPVESTLMRPLGEDGERSGALMPNNSRELPFIAVNSRASDPPCAAPAAL